jgi:phosphatidylcholine synthase
VNDLLSGPKADTAAKIYLQIIFAWLVHFYTALGLVAAAGIAVLIIHGGPAAFRWSFILMAIAMAVDATDGTLARLAKVKQVLPGFQGARLDDLIDFLTYVCLPLLLIYRAELLPTGWAWVLLLPLLASAYGFCQTSAKTEDGSFLGFPSYWNVVAFYLYVLRLPGWIAIGLLLLFAALTFVPSRYLYPSQKGRLSVLTNVLGAVWALLIAFVLWRLPTDKVAEDTVTYWLAVASVAYPAYYLIASWSGSLRRALRQ